MKLPDGAARLRSRSNQARSKESVASILNVLGQFIGG